MPTVAHSLLGGAIALIFYIITNSNNWNSEKKFTERMVILVALNSFIGPDIFTMLYAFGLGELAEANPLRATVHSVFGWPLWCLLIMVLWYYAINLRSTEQTKLSLKSTFLLLVAAGEIHFFMDAMDAGIYLFGFADWRMHISFQELFMIDTLYQTGPLTSIFPWFSMGEMFMVGLFFMFLLTYSLFRWEMKYTWLIAGLFLFIIISLYFLLGANILGGTEHDMGAILYFGGLLILPLGLMVISIE